MTRKGNKVKKRSDNAERLNDSKDDMINYIKAISDGKNNDGKESKAWKSFKEDLTPGRIFTILFKFVGICIFLVWFHSNLLGKVYHEQHEERRSGSGGDFRWPNLDVRIDPLNVKSRPPFRLNIAADDRHGSSQENIPLKVQAQVKYCHNNVIKTLVENSIDYFDRNLILNVLKAHGFNFETALVLVPYLSGFLMEINTYHHYYPILKGQNLGCHFVIGFDEDYQEPVSLVLLNINLMG